MKKKYLLILTVALLAFSTEAFSQFTFSVSPGMHLNGTQFGYTINGKLMPYISIQYLKAGFTQTDSYMHWDYDTNAAAREEDSREVNGSILIPSIGIKYALITKEKLHGYVTAAISKPIVNAELKYDGEVVEELDDEVDAISLFGGQAGVGAEYFFDENFSIGGEFGLAYMKVNYDMSYEDDYYNPDTSTYIDYTGENCLKANILPTYSKISLNFYF